MEFSDYPITNKNILGALLVSTHPLFQRFVEFYWTKFCVVKHTNGWGRGALPKLLSLSYYNKLNDDLLSNICFC